MREKTQLVDSLRLESCNYRESSKEKKQCTKKVQKVKQRDENKKNVIYHKIERAITLRRAIEKKLII